jgi:hypothetical protein
MGFYLRHICQCDIGSHCRQWLGQRRIGSGGAREVVVAAYSTSSANVCRFRRGSEWLITNPYDAATY